MHLRYIKYTFIQLSVTSENCSAKYLEHSPSLCKALIYCFIRPSSIVVETPQSQLDKFIKDPSDAIFKYGFVYIYLFNKVW